MSKKLFIVLFVFVMTLLFLGCGNGQDQKGSEDDEAAVNAIDAAAESQLVKQTIREIEKASQAGDLTAYLRFFADDAVLLAPDSPAIEGKPGIGAAYGHIFDTFELTGAHETKGIDFSEDTAIVWGVFSGLATPKAGGDPNVLASKYLFVFKKNIDGKYLLWRAAYNSKPPSTP